MAKYGVPAARYGDFAILRGDPSDGLPGVPGVGEKTAAALVAAYDSLDELLEAAEAVRSRRARRTVRRGWSANLRAASDYVRTMQQVVPMRADVEVTEWRHEPEAEAHRRAGGAPPPHGRGRTLPSGNRRT